ncbi:MAG: COX15/CtaA family protein [Acidocella sp.]|nr:COX15/CtaA family protein [Acidocella sp.]
MNAPTAQLGANRLVANWLFLICAMVFGMVAGGGHIRTLDAGFIMQDWRPFTGFIPPLNAGSWAAMFARYQQTAAYHANPISTASFHALFWANFLDRVWGRLIALAFALPLAWFWWRGLLTTRLALRLLAIFAAGGAQAAFGWVIVISGRQPGVLTPPPALAAPHFIVAMLILAALLWTACSLRTPNPVPVPHSTTLRRGLTASLVLVFLTMSFGALVAATNAIMVYNSFPLMDGHVTPPGLFALHPVWMNFLANQGNVQFFHRLLATIALISVLSTAIAGLRRPLPPALRDLFLIAAGLIALQYLLGMAALILAAPEIGYLHELNATLLFCTLIATRHHLRAPATQRMIIPEHVFAGAE